MKTRKLTGVGLKKLTLPETLDSGAMIPPIAGPSGLVRSLACETVAVAGTNVRFEFWIVTVRR
jgi:hypothetical protein